MAGSHTNRIALAALSSCACALFLVESSTGRANGEDTQDPLASTIATATEGAEAPTHPLTAAPASPGEQLESLQQRVGKR